MKQDRRNPATRFLSLPSILSILSIPSKSVVAILAVPYVFAAGPG